MFGFNKHEVTGPVIGKEEPKEEPTADEYLISNIKFVETQRLHTLMKHIIRELDIREDE